MMTQASIITDRHTLLTQTPDRTLTKFLQSSSMVRLPQLDAVRGLAALIVVLHHALLCLPQQLATRVSLADSPLLNILILGRPSVQLFFVLSGYVLALSLMQTTDSWTRFAIRRAFRLLPAFWASLLIAALLHRAVPAHHAPGMSAWFNEQWTDFVSATDVLRSALMLASANLFPLNQVVWSLVHEFRLALTLPLILFAFRRVGPLACGFAAVVTFIAVEAISRNDPINFPRGIHEFLFDAPGFPSIAVTGRVLTCFVLGAGLAFYRDHMHAMVGTWTWLRGAALTVSYPLLSQRSEFAMAIGAALLIYAAVESAWVARALSPPFFAWLGRISFSLYLVHLPLMLVSGVALSERLGPALAIAIAVAVSIVVAELMQRFVEQPGVWLSRRMLARRTAARSIGLVPATERS